MSTSDSSLEAPPIKRRGANFETVDLVACGSLEIALRAEGIVINVEGDKQGAITHSQWSRGVVIVQVVVGGEDRCPPRLVRLIGRDLALAAAPETRYEYKRASGCHG